MPIPFNVPHLTLNTSDKMPLVGLGTSKVRTKKILKNGLIRSRLLFIYLYLFCKCCEVK